MARFRISEAVPIDKSDPLVTLELCGGYYECPKDKEGNRRGPLVGYAGTYRGNDGHTSNFVGEVYFNFAKVEEVPHALAWFAAELGINIRVACPGVDHVLAAPMGGVALGSWVAAGLDVRFVFAEKKVVELPTATSRGKSILVLDRHEIAPDSWVAISEDVTNNFSTTAELVGLVEKAGARVGVIATAFNRSELTEWNGIPVVSVARIPTRQYRQDDPYVIADVETLNVVMKPKDSWSLLMEAMGRNRQ